MISRDCAPSHVINNLTGGSRQGFFCDSWAAEGEGAKEPFAGATAPEPEPRLRETRLHLPLFLLLLTTAAPQRNNFQFFINPSLHPFIHPGKFFTCLVITRSSRWYTFLLHCLLLPSYSGPSQATSDMPKRVAEEYITKEHGSIANPASVQNQPTMSTAAQLAKRK